MGPGYERSRASESNTSVTYWTHFAVFAVHFMNGENCRTSSATSDPFESPAILVRRERDLNPRYPYGYTRLPIAHLRPLGHLSQCKATIFTSAYPSGARFESPAVQKKPISGERGIRFSSLPSWKLLEPASPLWRRSPYRLASLRSARGSVRIPRRTDGGTFTERGGFEPPEPLRVQRFSRPPDSTALASLQGDEAKRIRTSDLQIRNLALYPAEL